MRENKSRGRRLDNGKWAYGSLIIHISEEGKGLTRAFIEEIPSHWNTTDKNAHFWEHRRYKVDLKTVGQFTDLKDKNGKDLDWWEGDLFDVLGTIRQIILEDGCFWFKAIDKTATPQRLICFTTMYATDFFPQKFGNIHENPELLK